jgi:hypothetical protein
MGLHFSAHVQDRLLLDQSKIRLLCNESNNMLRLLCGKTEVWANEIMGAVESSL